MSYDPRVLTWINRERAADGREPLDELRKGYSGDPLACVVARSLGNNAFVAPAKGGGHFSIADNEDLPLPEFVSEFASDFDNGCYPELVLAA